MREPAAEDDSCDAGEHGQTGEDQPRNGGQGLWDLGQRQDGTRPGATEQHRYPTDRGQHPQVAAEPPTTGEVRDDGAGCGHDEDLPQLEADHEQHRGKEGQHTR